MKARQIPSIEKMRQRPAIGALEKEFGRTAIVDALRAEAETLRARLNGGDPVDGDLSAALEDAAIGRLRASAHPSLRTVINATGVVLHTNMGRAPLSDAAVEAVTRTAAAYCNLEYDIEAGGRGRRDVHATAMLCSLSGAEAACIVNNNAAAALLTLAALAAGREVIVSRGELVEIGGGFRVPDVMQQSGAVLREVGTTNRTRAADYAAAISERTALILRVHPSNFRMTGFTERANAQELVALGRKFNVPVVEDLGSGWLGPPIAALREEPSVTASIRAGIDVVTFSGDKLLGGPQAGIILGRQSSVDTIRRHPLMRALRADKMTYAALEATLRLYAAERWDLVPSLRMLRMDAGEIGVRAEAVARGIASEELEAEVIDGESTIGGGSAPGETLPTRLIALRRKGLSAVDLERHLRKLEPPIVARILDGRVVLDLRTVLPSQDSLLLKALGQLLTTQLPTPNS